MFVDARATITDSVFQRNLASRGAAVYALGITELTLVRCLFQENEASLVGGAVLQDGTGSLSIQDSVFDRNIIRASDWASVAAVTVRLYT